MAGIAAATAEIYARYNIPTLPIGDDKRPLVSGFKMATFSMRQSRAFMQRQPTADAIGVPDGPLSGIVRLDIDERGDHILREVTRRAGEPGAIARTASGKFHLWYADNGERRLTGQSGHRNARPWDDLRVDLCGKGGYAISPPSRFVDGSEYKFEGEVNLDDLLRDRHRLPKIQGMPNRAYAVQVGMHPALATPALATSSEALAVMRDGSGRNVNLFLALCRMARSLPKSIEGFLDWAHEYNSEFGEAMTDAEVVRTAKSVFGYWERDELRSGEHGVWLRKLQAQDMARDPYFLSLIAWLKAENGPTSVFLVADGLASSKYLSWPRERFRRARRRAIDDGWIVEIQKPAPGRAALYRWGPMYTKDRN
jgi:Bifunctional DNA primase/polymerase, N-terminal